MVHLRSSFLVAILVSPIVALALPKPVDGAISAPRDAEPKIYSGVYLNRYEETVGKEKRAAEAEAEAAGKATYGGVFLNRYEESVEKEKRDAEAKATYGGVFLNRYEESTEKE
ncbi:MAG: hypothetical protein Q9195_005448 [Heterodermia aff. obscurata]